MRRLLRGLGLGVAIGLVGALLALTPVGDALEHELGRAWLFAWRGAAAPPADVVVVSLDRRSAERLGLPLQPRAWPRSSHARLIERLSDAGAAVIVLDLYLETPGVRPEDDRELARAIAAADRVALFSFLDRRTMPILDAAGNPTGLVSIEERLVPPREIFAEGARATGPFPLPRTPGRVDQFWVFKSGAGDPPTLPAIALQLYARDTFETWRGLLAEAGAPGLAELPSAETATSADPVELILSQRRMFLEDPDLADRVAARIAAATLPERTARSMRALLDLHAGPDSRHLNLYGPPGRLVTLPYHVVLEADGGPLDLAGKAVFVGAADLRETGAGDGFDTVYSASGGEQTSGVEIMASAFANLLDGNSLRSLPTAAESALLFVLGIAFGLIALRLPMALAIAGVIALAGVHAAIAQAAFAHAVWLPLALPLTIQLPLAMVLGLLAHYRRAQRGRQRVGAAIRYYLPDAVARQLDEGDDGSATGDAVVYGVCLATDAEGYTHISEVLPPRELTAMLNAYYGVLTEPVRRHGGRVSDIVADAMMCIWTSDRPEPARRLEACLAAIEIVASVNMFNRDRGAHALPTRVGLHAGWVSLGHVGGGGRFAYSVVGDIANTASRLEQLNKRLGTRILASAETVTGLDGLLSRPLGRFVLAGKTEPLAVVELLGPEASASPAMRRLPARFVEACALAEAGRHAEALAAFEAILVDHPADGPTRLQRDRVRRLAKRRHAGRRRPPAIEADNA